MRIPPPTAPGPPAGPNPPRRPPADPPPARYGPRLDRPESPRVGGGLPVVASQQQPAVEVHRRDPLDEDARRVTGVGGDDELARPWCAALVRVGVHQEPVARLERGAHAL